MGLQFPVARRGFGEVWYDPSTWAEDDGSSDSSSDTLNAEEGMFNSPEDEFFSYSGPDLEDDGSVSTAVEDSAGGSLLEAIDAWAYDNKEASGVEQSTIGTAISTSDKPSQQKAAYSYGYERGRGDKLAGNPADPSAAIATVGSTYADYAAQGYADGYAGAKNAATTDPAKVGGKVVGTTDAKKTEEGMSTAAKVGIALGVGGLVAVGVMAARKRRRGR